MRNLTVGMENTTQEISHPGDALSQQRCKTHRHAACLDQGLEVEKIFQKYGVVHGRALEMSAIGKNLLSEFPPQQLLPLAPPAQAFGCIEERPSKHQRLDILHEVIC